MHDLALSPLRQATAGARRSHSGCLMRSNIMPTAGRRLSGLSATGNHSSEKTRHHQRIETLNAMIATLKLLILRRMCEAAKVKTFGFHAIRHLAVSIFNLVSFAVYKSRFGGFTGRTSLNTRKPPCAARTSKPSSSSASFTRQAALWPPKEPAREGWTRTGGTSTRA
jgi:hypothetical protein